MLSTTTDSKTSFAGAMRGLAFGAIACLLFALLPLAVAAQERVGVEMQRHDNHARLIVTFPDRLALPAHQVTSDNGVLVIGFETALSGTLPDIGTGLSDYVTIARFDPDMRSIRMGMRTPLQIHTIEAGEQLYIDLLPLDWVGLPPSLPPETIARLAQRAEDAARIAEERRRAEMVLEYNPQVSVRVGRHPTFSRVIFDWTVGTKAVFSQDDNRAEIAFDWPIPIDLYEILSDRPAELIAVSNSVNPGNSVISLEVAEGAGMRFYEDTSARFILDIDFPNAVREGVEAARLAVANPPATSGNTEVETSVAEAVDVTHRPPQQSVIPYVTTVGATVRVVFPFEQDTPAAVFRRGNTVWMVFDTPAGVEQPRREEDATFDALVGDFSVEAMGGSQVVRMELEGSRLATIGSEGRAWVLSLGDVLLSATEPLILERRQGIQGFNEIVVDLERPARVHKLFDPEVGDVLDVVTAYPPARGVVRDLDYVDFSAPRTIHGFVVRPLHEEVNVRIEDRLAVVAAEAGLILSQAQEVRFRPPAESRLSAMDLFPFMAANPHDFARKRTEIVLRTAEDEGRMLERARLDLARFYLSNNYPHEALGVLSVMRGDVRQADLEPSVLITLGAANTLAGRTGEALLNLNSEILRDEADTMIWRAIARVQNSDFEGARLDAIGAEQAINGYPNWVRSRFLLAGTRAAIVRDDTSLATRLLGRIDLAQLTRDQVSEYELLTGMLDELNGSHVEALESYGRVILADRRPTTAEAVLRTIRLLDRMGSLDLPRAIDTLAVQATIWRGDKIELDIILALADLQYRNGNYRDAFNLTREASAFFPGSEVLSSLMARAQGEFVGLYLDGRADSLDPVEALSIYYDFRQLTPAGTQGDHMIRNLAQRLIKVDLLTQAAELLSYQVEHRLQGAARAQVAADLAIVHIANRDPAEALQVLYRTRLAGLPPGLERQRRVLEARALIDVNRNDLALDLLSPLSGRDTELLRIEALWKGQRYREAGELIELLYASDLDRGALSPIARTNIVRAGVGYVMANDQIGLSRLRSRFSEAMSITPEWPMFSFVTSDVEVTGREFRDIAREIAAVDSLNAFLNAYREIYTAENALTPLRGARGGS